MAGGIRYAGSHHRQRRLHPAPPDLLASGDDSGRISEPQPHADSHTNASQAEPHSDSHHPAAPADLVERGCAAPGAAAC